MDILKVSAKSGPSMVAGAVAAKIRESGSVEVQAIGAGAVNQALKAIAIARNFFLPNDIELICIPMFTEVEIEGEMRTAIRLVVETRKI